jgi:hypothetical protein
MYSTLSTRSIEMSSWALSGYNASLEKEGAPSRLTLSSVNLPARSRPLVQ